MATSERLITDDEDKRRKKGQPRHQLAMKLHLVSGNLWAGAGAAAGGCSTIMEAEVWSRLPDELILEVLRFVPVAQQFQLQSLSRKWRQLLTSDDFCHRSRAQHRTVAYVTRCNSEDNEVEVVDMETSSRSDCKLNCKVVDMSLFSFVPKSFWCKTYEPTYYVVAAANGLVCISTPSPPRETDRKQRSDPYDWEAWEKWDSYKERSDSYCVLNPVTRTCKVLPQIQFEQVQWLPPTSTAFTVLGYFWDEKHRQEWEEADDKDRDGQPWPGWGGKVQVATYDLTANGSGRWDLAEYKCDEDYWGAPPAALCSGETFLFYRSWLHVLAPDPGAGGRLVEVAAVEEPSEALMGQLDASQDWINNCEHLVAHRGAVFFVKKMAVDMRDRTVPGLVDAVVGVWRLARKQLEWEAVARLDLADVERLTAAGLDGWCMDQLDVCGVREFLCFHVGAFRGDKHFFLGFNLDTGEWEVLNQEAMHSGNISHPFELRPDLFLTGRVRRKKKSQKTKARRQPESLPPQMQVAVEEDDDPTNGDLSQSWDLPLQAERTLAQIAGHDMDAFRSRIKLTRARRWKAMREAYAAENPQDIDGLSFRVLFQDDVQILVRFAIEVGQAIGRNGHAGQIVSTVLTQLTID